MKEQIITALVIFFIFVMAGIAVFFAFNLGGSLAAGAKDGGMMVQLEKSQYDYGEPLTISLFSAVSPARTSGMINSQTCGQPIFAVFRASTDVQDLKITIDGVPLENSLLMDRSWKTPFKVLTQNCDRVGGINNICDWGRCEKPTVSCVYQNNYKTAIYSSEGVFVLPSEFVRHPMTSISLPQYLKNGTHKISFYWSGSSAYSLWSQGLDNPYCAGQLHYDFAENKYYAEKEFYVSNNTYFSIACKDAFGRDGSADGENCVLKTADSYEYQFRAFPAYLTCPVGSADIMNRCVFSMFAPKSHEIQTIIFQNNTIIVPQIIEKNNTIIQYIEKNNTEQNWFELIIAWFKSIFKIK